MLNFEYYIISSVLMLPVLITLNSITAENAEQISVFDV